MTYEARLLKSKLSGHVRDGINRSFASDGNSIQYLKDFIGDGSFSVVGSYNRGLPHACRIGATLGRQKTQSGEYPFFVVVPFTLHGYSDRPGGELKDLTLDDSVHESVMKGDRIVFIDETTDGYDSVDVPFIATRDVVLRFVDSETCKLDAYRFVVASPFDMMTAQRVYKDRFEWGKQLALSDLGKGPAEFLVKPLPKIKSFLAGDRYVVVSSEQDTLNGLAICLSLSSNNRDSFVAMDDDFGRQIDRFKGRKVVLVGSDQDALNALNKLRGSLGFVDMMPLEPTD